MNKFNFKNGQAPYLSDVTLNKMQDNIEEAIQEVSNTIITETASDIQNGLMSKEDKVKLDTLENIEVIQKGGEATTENIYSAKAVKGITEELNNKITNLEERKYLKNISVHTNDNKFDNVSQIISDLKDYEAYCITNHPIEDGVYIQNGASHTVLGMQYGELKYGSQLSFGLNGMKFRTQNNGTWSAWQTK